MLKAYHVFTTYEYCDNWGVHCSLCGGNVVVKTEVEGQ